MLPYMLLYLSHVVSRQMTQRPPDVGRADIPNILGLRLAIALQA